MASLGVNTFCLWVRSEDKDKKHEIDVVKNSTLKSELIRSYHYYPFGMRMEGKWTEHWGEDYDFQYNAKEYETANKSQFYKSF
jgi:hypothetical protein